MKPVSFVFNRIEKKYAITAEQKERLLKSAGERLIPDEYGESTVLSLYLDTENHLLIRNSIDADIYKEKLRLRSYGVPNPDSTVFLEIKKKLNGVVYKRRVNMTYTEALDFLKKDENPRHSQIMDEIRWSIGFYGHPKPAMLIAYDREAFYVKDLPNLRITFDKNVRFRKERLFLDGGADGELITPKGVYLMEIKTDGAMPVWLSHILDECKILPTSFSKYGTAYSKSYLNKN